MRAVPVLLLLAGCLDELPPEDPGTAARGACTALEGQTFQSLAMGECGLTPQGPGSCFWHLKFSAEDGTRTRFTWSHSDVEESGLVTCDGTTIHTVQAFTPYEGTFDEMSLDVMWDDRAYAVVSP